MSLNRAQKRNLALLLVARAKSVVADWDSVSSKSYHEIEDGGLKGITRDDVREVYAQWLGYLPNHAWDKVDEPQTASEAPAASESYNTNQDEEPRTESAWHGESSTYADNVTYGGAVSPAESYDPKAESEGIADHVNPAISEETPVMGDNALHHENEVLHSQPVEDDDPTGDKQVVEHSTAGDPQPFQYR